MVETAESVTEKALSAISARPTDGVDARERARFAAFGAGTRKEEAVEGGGAAGEGGFARGEAKLWSIWSIWSCPCGRDDEGRDLREQDLSLYFS